MTAKTREEILHAFNAELVYIRTNFPMGKTGLKIKDGSITPSGEELQRLMAMWGPAVKPGDQARISDVSIKSNFIRFEINGGPVKKQKWYQHIQIQGSQPTTVTPGGEAQPGNPRGSYVDLYFDKFVPEMTGPELKDLLWPVFDFDSKTPLEAYLESVPAKVKEAIQNHHVLVGMNQQMVIYAKGRPPKRLREQDGDTAYEEWIFGTPPEDVDFVRFVGDEVVRVETMKVDGQKVVRVEKEVNLDDTTVAAKKVQPSGNAPTLRRPGEDTPDTPRQNPSPTPVYAPQPTPEPPGGDPGPNWLPTE
ncbi:MAG TPA: hypothetical protein VMT67_01765 [Terriglobales bacterium]|nr:hypothetical protein [Terriglobales bacterium]